MSEELTEKEKFIKKLNFLLEMSTAYKDENEDDYFNLLNEELVPFMLDYTDYYDDEDLN
jgi:hypothetical protein